MPGFRLSALARIAFLAVALLLCGARAHADTVSEWSRIAVRTVSELEADPARAARNLATVHIAMFEAMNFIEGRYAPRYLVRPQRPAGMSSEATAATAAHRVLVELYPARADALDDSLQRSFTALFGSQQRNSIVIGEKLADIVRIVRRRNELSDEAAGRNESVQQAVQWATTVSRYLEDRPGRAIEDARLYAIAALAVDEAYAAARSDPATCVACTINAALQVIVGRQSQAGSASANGLKIGRQALAYYPQTR
jgi:hypothetical protein